MVTITCQHSGIVFEAETRRTKNHPKVSDLLTASAAGQAGEYGAAMKLFAECREQKMTDVDEVISFVNAGLEAFRTGAKLDRQRFFEQQKANKEKRKEREHLNSFLRQHGYCWRRVGFADEEEADMVGAIGERFESEHWELFSPQNTRVSIESAIAQIKEETGREYRS